MNRFGLTDIQAQAILDMRLQRLTNLEILSLRKEYEELLKRISALKGILASEKKLLKLIRGELEDVRAMFDDPRRTQIVGDFAASEIREDAPEAEEAVVLVTRNGFVKRMQPKVFERAMAANENAETPRFVINVMTDEKLLFFTDLGNCYAVAVEQAPECRMRERGLALGGLLAGLEADENLVCVINAGKFEGEVTLVTKNGMIKRTALADFNVRKGRYSVMGLKDDDRLVAAMNPAGYESLLLVSRCGMAIHFTVNEVSVIGRTAAGVKAMSLGEGDVVGFVFAHNGEGEVVLITDLGYMKRCLLIDFDRQARGGKGVRCVNLLKNGSNGSCIAGALMVTDPYDFRILQKGGTATTFNTEDVGIETKSGKGQPYVVVVMGDVVIGLQR